MIKGQEHLQYKMMHHHKIYGSWRSHSPLNVRLIPGRYEPIEPSQHCSHFPIPRKRPPLTMIPSAASDCQPVSTENSVSPCCHWSVWHWKTSMEPIHCWYRYVIDDIIRPHMLAIRWQSRGGSRTCIVHLAPEICQHTISRQQVNYRVLTAAVTLHRAK